MAQYHHSLRFDTDRCDGCMSCMRICPTAAVRIRNERAVKLAEQKIKENITKNDQDKLVGDYLTKVVQIQ